MPGDLRLAPKRVFPEELSVMKTSAACLALLIALLIGLPAAPLAAQTYESDVVNASSVVLDEVMGMTGRGIPLSLLAHCQGVAIVPDLLKGGFIVGVRHGRGVLLIRDPTGTWQPPQFISVNGGSVGWQVGLQATDLVLVFKTTNSIRGLLRGKLTLGADISVAAGPVGREASAATDSTLRAEILSYSRSRGLFAGVALDGSVVQVDPLSNTAFYAAPAPPLAQPGTAITLPTPAVQLLRRINGYAGPGGPAGPAVAAVPGSPAGGPPSLPPPSLAGPAAAPQTLTPPPDLESIRRDLRAASAKLRAMLPDDQWGKYLAMPADLFAADRQPSDAELAAVLQHYDLTAQSPQYRALTDRPEFRATHDLLRRYLAARSASPRSILGTPGHP
jgi:lipid-binding SYLF domain-containing protein